MPIKFRCKYCQQLLGISVSRAGAVVDCPQCGRSLRVPELDGKVRKLPTVSAKAKSDAALISALSELSALGDGDVAVTHEAPVEPRRTVTPVISRQNQTAPLEPLPVDFVGPVDPVAIVSDGADSPSNFDFQDDPVAISDSLAVLAGWDESDSRGVVSDELLADMRAADQREQFASLGWLLLCLLMLAIGLGSGWWLAKSSGKLFGDSESPDVQNQHPVDAKVGAELELEGQGSVRGIVTYVDGSGKVLPDDGATIIALPVVRNGTLKFDGRTLRKEPADPDRKITEAALAVLGGFVVDADELGKFQVPVRLSTPYMVTAISRHQSRDSDVAVDSEVDGSLRAYFDSSNHLCGKLAAKAAVISDINDSNPVKFEFGTAGL